MRVLYNSQRGEYTNTHPSEGGHQVLHETTQAIAQQRMHTPGRQSFLDIYDIKIWVQGCHSDPVTDGETPLPGASLG